MLCKSWKLWLILNANQCVSSLTKLVQVLVKTSPNIFIKAYGCYTHSATKKNNNWINRQKENTIHFYYQYFTTPNAWQTIGAALIRLFNCPLSSPDGYSSCCHPASALLLIIVLIHSCIPQKPKAITLCKPYPAVCLSLVNGSAQHAVKL